MGIIQKEVIYLFEQKFTNTKMTKQKQAKNKTKNYHKKSKLKKVY